MGGIKVNTVATVTAKKGHLKPKAGMMWILHQGKPFDFLYDEEKFNMVYEAQARVEEINALPKVDTSGPRTAEKARIKLSALSDFLKLQEKGSAYYAREEAEKALGLSIYRDGELIKTVKNKIDHSSCMKTCYTN